CKSGVVRLRVELLANGKVGNITPICELPYGLTEQAAKAAKKIKYVPKKRNGIAISVTKTIEYTFTPDETGLFGTKIYQSDEKAEAVIQKAIQRLGGERYLAVKTATGRGNFTAMKENEASLPSTFSDYIVYPDKERTEFKTGGVKTIQTNVGDGGWFADTGARVLKDQTPEQVADFKFSIRTGLDSFLRGNWRNEKDAKLEYVGRREASLGKRNEVVKLTYADGLAIEFEFAAQDGTPAKVSYNRPNVGAEESKEEDRFAQFVEVGGVFVPYIIDHYRNGKQTSRVNYESIRFNDPVPDALFIKPKDIKKLK
ncbi:MAG: energy transducer TonB, partial [Pyrinomonadaceae bacterium]